MRVFMWSRRDYEDIALGQNNPNCEPCVGEDVR